MNNNWISIYRHLKPAFVVWLVFLMDDFSRGRLGYGGLLVEPLALALGLGLVPGRFKKRLDISLLPYVTWYGIQLSNFMTNAKLSQQMFWPCHEKMTPQMALQMVPQIHSKRNPIRRVVFSPFFRQACQVTCRNFELDQNFSWVRPKFQLS